MPGWLWRTSTVVHPASGVAIVTRTLLGRWTWKRVARLPGRLDG